MYLAFSVCHAYWSGDQLSVQNSLKINIKFLDSLLVIDFYSLTIIFFPRLFLDISIFFIFSLDRIVNSLIVKAKPWQLVSQLTEWNSEQRYHRVTHSLAQWERISAQEKVIIIMDEIENASICLTKSLGHIQETNK